MKTRVNRNFILDNENLDKETLLVNANIYGYPYFRYEDNIYFVRITKKNKLRPVLVTDDIEEV
jgi:hypothetical protein